jgi:hypothetical protein
VSINEVGTAKPGEGAVRRKPGVKELATSPYPGVTTLYENFQYASSLAFSQARSHFQHTRSQFDSNM